MWPFLARTAAKPESDQAALGAYLDRVAIPAALEALKSAETLAASTGGAAAAARASALAAKLAELRLRRDAQRAR